METDLAYRRKMAEIMVSEKDTRLADRDDLIQEALIAAWRTQAMPRAFQLAAMRNRITETATRGNWFGKEGHRGWQDANNYADPVDIPDSPEWQEMDPHILAWRAHEVRAGITDSLNEKERDYVLHRFWLGYTPGELGKNSWRTWKSARPKLQERLAHLEM